MTTRNSPRVLIWSIKLGRGVQVPSNPMAEIEMTTFVQRCQLIWSFELRTVVSWLESREAGEFCS